MGPTTIHSLRGKECKICHADTCECKQRLVAFFRLLRIADTRVSTPKAASTPTAVHARIDKLEGSLGTPQLRSEIEKRLEQSQIEPKLKFLQKQCCLEIHEGFFLHIGHQHGEIISRFICNPSAFPSYDTFLKHLRIVFTHEASEAIQITRLDVAIDYAVNIQKLIRGLDLRNKQVDTRFTDKCGRRTGALFGKGNEKLSVYDKGLEAGLSEELTRIELQLRGSKLPARKWKELDLVLQSDCDFFSHISLADVAVKEEILESRKKRTATLKRDLERDGLFAFRKALNVHGNFERDVRPLLEVTPWEDQPQTAFKRLFKQWFSPDHETNVKPGLIGNDLANPAPTDNCGHKKER